MKQELFTYDEAKQLSLTYFNDDEIAADAYLNKYALKEDGDINKIIEPTPLYMHKRLAKEFARIEAKFKNSLSENEIFELIDNFKYIIPQGGSMSGIGNPLPISLANCFVIGGDEDSYGSIMKIDEEQIQISKRRGGVGHDLSSIRPEGIFVNNSARSSTGMVPFMKRYSNSIREVAQDGRRGALMLSCSITHPDSEKFIDAKLDTTQITGANISIKLSDEFMMAVKNNDTFIQQFPINSNNPILIKETNAKGLWDKIMFNAWKSAEPGILFWSKVLSESISKLYGKRYMEISTNPCAELPLCAYASCILISLNLYGYVKNPFTKDAYFDKELFIKHVKITQRLADDIIELELEKINQIIHKIISDPESQETKSRELNLWMKIKETHINTRRTGVGITAEGDMLAALGFVYGMDDANNKAIEIQKLLASASYESSIELAKERGAFPIWDYETEKDAVFINRLITEKLLSPQHLEDYKKYGRRNIANLTIAPTGSVSLLSQTTSGIECVFLPYYTRRRKVNDTEEFDFIDDNGDKFKEYNIVHHKLADYYKAEYEKNGCSGISKHTALKYLQSLSKDELEQIVKNSPYNNATSSTVNWVGKVKLQGMMQKYIDHAISVTVNLPNDATVDLVSEVYMTAWESGCKGLTIYRDGSRDGILVNKENDKKGNILSSGARSKRKPILPAIVDVIKSNREYFAIITGVDNNQPYEVFAFKLENDEVELFKNTKQTTVTKLKKKIYSLGDEFSGIKNYDNILLRFGSEEEQAITRMVSTMLRGGRIPLTEVIDQISKSSTSIDKFSKILGKCLTKFLKDGMTLHQVCEKCGGKMAYYEACVRCLDCGDTKC